MNEFGDHVNYDFLIGFWKEEVEEVQRWLKDKHPKLEHWSSFEQKILVDVGMFKSEIQAEDKRGKNPDTLEVAEGKLEEK